MALVLVLAFMSKLPKITDMITTNTFIHTRWLQFKSKRTPRLHRITKLSKRLSKIKWLCMDPRLRAWYFHQSTLQRFRAGRTKHLFIWLREPTWWTEWVLACSKRNNIILWQPWTTRCHTSWTTNDRLQIWQRYSKEGILCFLRILG